MRSIRLTDSQFANSLIGKYGWSIGQTSNRRGLMVYRTESKSRASASAPLHVDVHIRHIRSMLQMVNQNIQQTIEQRIQAESRVTERHILREIREIREIAAPRQETQARPNAERANDRKNDRVPDSTIGQPLERQAEAQANRLIEKQVDRKAELHQRVENRGTEREVVQERKDKSAAAPHKGTDSTDRPQDRQIDRVTEKQLERRIEQRVERQLEPSIEREVKERIERQAEQSIEQQVEKRVEQTIEQQIVRQVEQQAERRIAQQIEQRNERQAASNEEQSTDPKAANRLEQGRQSAGTQGDRPQEQTVSPREASDSERLSQDRERQSSTPLPLARNRSLHADFMKAFVPSSRMKTFTVHRDMEDTLRQVNHWIRNQAWQSQPTVQWQGSPPYRAIPAFPIVHRLMSTALQQTLMGKGAAVEQIRQRLAELSGRASKGNERESSRRQPQRASGSTGSEQEAARTNGPAGPQARHPIQAMIQQALPATAQSARLGSPGSWMNGTIDGTVRRSGQLNRYVSRTETIVRNIRENRNVTDAAPTEQPPQREATQRQHARIVHAVPGERATGQSRGATFPRQAAAVSVSRDRNPSASGAGAPAANERAVVQIRTRGEAYLTERLWQHLEQHRLLQRPQLQRPARQPSQEGTTSGTSRVQAGSNSSNVNWDTVHDQGNGLTNATRIPIIVRAKRDSSPLSRDILRRQERSANLINPERERRENRIERDNRTITDNRGARSGSNVAGDSNRNGNVASVVQAASGVRASASLAPASGIAPIASQPTRPTTQEHRQVGRVYVSERSEDRAKRDSSASSQSQPKTTVRNVTHNPETPQPVSQQQVSIRSPIQNYALPRNIAQRVTVQNQATVRQALHRHGTQRNATQDRSTRQLSTQNNMKSSTSQNQTSQQHLTPNNATQNQTTQQHLTQNNATQNQTSQQHLTQSNATRNQTSQQHLTQSNATQNQTTQQHLTQHNTTQNHTTQQHLTQRNTTHNHTTQQHLTQRNITQNHTTQRIITQRHTSHSHTSHRHLTQINATQNRTTLQNITHLRVGPQAASRMAPTDRGTAGATRIAPLGTDRAANISHPIAPQRRRATMTNRMDKTPVHANRLASAIASKASVPDRANEQPIAQTASGPGSNPSLIVPSSQAARPSARAGATADAARETVSQPLARLDVPIKEAVKQASPEPVIRSLEVAIKTIEQDLNQAKEEWAKPKVDVNRLADQMYKEFTKRLRQERQRRGI